ncbi:MAG TPA: S8/S53 family peptidase [Longimicrobiales bacterium]|nr:S8/S53 family peptidase [Longimicrobiales bacterium]
MNRRRRVSLVVIVAVALWLPACAGHERARGRAHEGPAYATTYFEPFWWYHWAGIKAAHDTGATGKGSRVAIVDTGLLLGHEDLPNAQPGVELCTGNDGIADDRTNGHGTELAGIVGGKKNGLATRGVAFEATLIPYKVVCGTTNAVVVYKGVARAVNASPPPDIVLLALGPWPGDTDDSGNTIDALLDIVVATHDKTLFVVASVWDRQYFPRPKWTQRPNVILVAAMTLDAARTREIPYNVKRGDIWAPGRDVGTASIEPVWSAQPHHPYRMQGTSAAAAIVAGCAALIKSSTNNVGARLRQDVLEASEDAGLPDGPRLKCSNKIR